MKFIADEWSVDMQDGRFERANSGPQRFTVEKIAGSRAGVLKSLDAELTFIKLKKFRDFQLLALVI